MEGRIYSLTAVRMWDVRSNDRIWNEPGQAPSLPLPGGFDRRILDQAGRTQSRQILCPKKGTVSDLAGLCSFEASVCATEYTRQNAASYVGREHRRRLATCVERYLGATASWQSPDYPSKFTPPHQLTPHLSGMLPNPAQFNPSRIGLADPMLPTVVDQT